MPDERSQRVEELYQLAVDMPRGERQEFLDRNCGGDESLRADVQTLIDHYEEARGEFMERPVLRLPGEEGENQVGPYQVERVLGEGGMGIVYLAKQLEPIRRQVALKVLKAGMDSKQIMARFEAERQALALMDHAGIAKVFDAGTTSDGQPYFAMEYVAGLPVTHFCDNQRMSVEGRMRLFARVCDAVQHAHQKGIIHRDIKPSNVLVTFQDGVPVPKVIDFGVAKAMEAQLTARSMMTQAGNIIGTPDYMSPEQAASDGSDVDTRTDVYSLGVVLYQLMTGQLPFDPKALRERGLEGMLHAIRTEDPPRASARVRALGKDVATAAQNRATRPTDLARKLEDDIDWISAQALEKERSQRYDSAAALAMDVRAYLSNDAVSARPPTWRYRTLKFAARNKAAMTALVSAVIVLVGFVGLLTVQNTRITRERDRANDEAATATRVSGLLVDIFRTADPNRRGRDVTAREIMETGVDMLEPHLEADPHVRARLELVLGEVYTNLGLYAQAETFLLDAMQRWSDLAARDLEHQASTMNALGRLYLLQGRYKESEPLLVGALELMELQDDPDELAIAAVQNNLGSLYLEIQSFDKAQPLLNSALDTRRRLLGENNEATLLSLTGVGRLHQGMGEHAEAEKVFREVLAKQEELYGAPHPNILLTYDNLAATLMELGRLDEAIDLMVSARDGLAKQLGPEHPLTLNAANDVGVLYMDARQLAKAESLIVENVAVQRRVLGENHPQVLAAKNSLANIYVYSRIEEATVIFEELLEAKRVSVGELHTETMMAMTNLGTTYVRRGMLDEAEPYLVEVHDLRLRALREDHPDHINSKQNLGVLYRNMGRFDEAEVLLLEALQLSEQILGPKHPTALRAMSSLSSTYQRQGKMQEAERYLRLSAEGRFETLGSHHPVAQRTMYSLARLYRQQGHFAEAETRYTQVIEAQVEALGETHPQTQATRSELTEMLAESSSSGTD